MGTPPPVLVMGLKVCSTCRAEFDSRGFRQHEAACKKLHTGVDRDLAYRTRNITPQVAGELSMLVTDYF